MKVHFNAQHKNKLAIYHLTDCAQKGIFIKNFFGMFAVLIHFDDTVDFPDEPEGGEKSDRSCKKEEAEHHDGGVTEVEEGGGPALDVQLGEEVVDAVAGQVEGREPAGQEAAPPPVVILSTEVEVAEEDGGLGAGDDQDDVHQEQEPVHVVNLRGPDGVENEEELDEDAAERENSAHDDSGDRLCVDALVWDLSGDLVGSDWLLDHRLPEAEVSADEGEGDGHAEPERQQRHQREERDRGGASVVPENQVHDEEVSKDDPGAEH